MSQHNKIDEFKYKHCTSFSEGLQPYFKSIVLKFSNVDLRDL